MSARLKPREGTGADIHADTVLGDIRVPLGVSLTADFPRRTYDAVRQPFTGWGLMWTRDDVDRIGGFLADGSQSQAIVHQGQLDSDLQRDTADRGLAPMDGYRYNKGFWAHDVGGRMPGWRGERWITIMSGYGGITVLILNNGRAY